MKKIYKPILFSTPMVQAELDGRKTQTRRMHGLQAINKNPDAFGLGKIVINNCFNFYDLKTEKGIWIQKKYNVGDILWVRETFGYDHHQEDLEKVIVYKADNAETTLRTETENTLPSGEIVIRNKSFWHPSIHMPKEAARIFLEVTNVRCERLQDISSRDAIAEGVEFEGDINDCPSFRNYLAKGLHKAFTFGYPYNSFWSLWESINGIESWKSNPWVWVYEFKKVEKPIVWPQ